MNGSGVVVGVDIGGTFTDVAIAAADGTLHLGKLPTTPEDPRVGVVQGVRQVLADAGLGADSVTRVVHGTTLATNVVLERRGGPVALVTTEGFGDLMRLGRQARVEEDRYDVLYTPPPPPVDATLTFEVAERLGARGEVLVPLADDAVRELTRRLTDADPVGIAVCFLHSYANPAHEHRVAAACRAALPDAFVAASCDVWPEMREYERAMTTVVCALVGPVMAGYLGGLERRLAEIGIHCGVEVMESSGGVMSAAAAARRPVCTVESGGAAGVITAGMIGDQIGAPDVISFDMGGTTAKTGIVRDGQPRLAHSFQVGGKGSFGATRAGTGVPVKTPVVDLAEVGAGGGSRAWIDAGGALRVGPGSAGAGPGPACYGRGGTEPTVTDANLLLGYLDPTGLAGGVTLSSERAARAIASVVADPLGLDVADAASAIHEIANATMAAAIRLVTVQRGIDPRDFTLVGFGGAGPVHVARLASTFGIRSVVVPWGAGVASAIGLVGSDPTVELVQTRLVEVADADPVDVEAVFAQLEARGRAELGVDEEQPLIVRRAADLRCRGQAHELTVAIAPGRFAPDGLEMLTTRFRDEYERAYGIRSTAGVELVNARVRLIRPVAKPPRRAERPPTGAAAPQPARHRAVRFPGEDRYVDAPIYDWGTLAAGARLGGPALVAGPDTTVVVPPAARVELDEQRNVLLHPPNASDSPVGTGTSPARTG